MDEGRLLSSEESLQRLLLTDTAEGCKQLVLREERLHHLDGTNVASGDGY